MLRTALLACLLAACGGSRDRGPAWPKPSPSETDGGETLEPRQASAVAAIEDAEDATPSAGAPAATTTTPAATPAATPARTDRPASETPAREPDVLTTEDIVIEIED
jgi:hypothetical protein